MLDNKGITLSIYQVEKSTIKAIAFVEKHIIYMQRQFEAFGKQIDIQFPAYIKYAITDFHSIAWMLIISAIIVTIYRNTSVPSQRYQRSHSILLTTTN